MLSPMMEEGEPSIIYGLDYQARCLCAVRAETSRIQFLIGTQSLRPDQTNQIYLLELNEESGAIRKKMFAHSVGEVWHLAAQPSDARIFASCHNSVDSDNVLQSGVTVWKFDGSDTDDGANMDDNNSGGGGQLTSVASFKANPSETVTCFDWQPTTSATAKAFILHGRNELNVVDIERQDIKQQRIWCVDAKTTGRASTAAWDPHHHCNTIAVALDTNVRAYDIRAPHEKPSYTIDSAHQPGVRTLDFNPNRQYTLCTGGDDGQIRLWDVRHAVQPLTAINAHSHWVWCVRYNPNHDQLLLSCSSDAQVRLHSLQSWSSDSVEQQPGEGGSDEDDGSDDDDQNSNAGLGRLDDGVLRAFDEHEDSVYACEWSAAEPWLFASLSYDGRLLLNRVPKQAKYAILGL